MKIAVCLSLHVLLNSLKSKDHCRLSVALHSLSTLLTLLTQMTLNRHNLTELMHDDPSYGTTIMCDSYRLQCSCHPRMQINTKTEWSLDLCTDLDRSACMREYLELHEHARARARTYSTYNRRFTFWESYIAGCHHEFDTRTKGLSPTKDENAFCEIGP